MTEKEASKKRRVVIGVGDKIEGIVDDIGRRIGNIFEAAVTGSRDNVVMVRVNDAALAKLDDLVDADIFKSRSQAAAFLLDAGIRSQQALFEQIDEKVREIRKLREQLRKMTGADADPDADADGK
jgi:Arc/MetJ-type ribon-helix-helix transcriptional regulator